MSSLQQPQRAYVMAAMMMISSTASTPSRTTSWVMDVRSSVRDTPICWAFR
jgi:hypothetical protein